MHWIGDVLGGLHALIQQPPFSIGSSFLCSLWRCCLELAVLSCVGGVGTSIGHAAVLFR